MESSRPQLLILADAPDALCILFGISLLERLLRVVQRLGFREAIILSNSPEEVAAHLSETIVGARGCGAELSRREMRAPCG